MLPANNCGLRLTITRLAPAMQMAIPTTLARLNRSLNSHHEARPITAGLSATINDAREALM
ncbi:hypothetical protein D3C75_1314720 [compost metagenome]